MNSKRRKSGTRRAAARKKRAKGVWRIIKIILVIAVVYCAVMYTPVFKVKDIVIEGTSIVDPQEALSAANITKGEHMLKIDRKNVKTQLEKIPYIFDAQVKYVWPSTIKLVIEEGEIYYSFKTEGGYLNTDKNLKILEITPEAKIFPVFEGINLQKKAAGEKITIDESEKFDIILVYYNVLKDKNILDKVETIKISEYSVFMKMKNGVNVKCGGQTDAELKIAALMECLEKEQAEIGTFDITDHKRIVYSID